MVNVTEMIKLIRAKPGIRTIELLRALDCDIGELVYQLETMHSITGELIKAIHHENGRVITAWTLAIDIYLPMASDPKMPEPMPVLRRTDAQNINTGK